MGIAFFENLTLDLATEVLEVAYRSNYSQYEYTRIDGSPKVQLVHHVDEEMSVDEHKASPNFGRNLAISRVRCSKRIFYAITNLA
jgi:hypothetical protein